MKVKNIMFFGAAAVILSAAGANAAFIPGSTTASTETKNIVTSKYYVDSGLDAKQNVQIAEAADAGKAVVVDAQGKINISANTLGSAAYTDSTAYEAALTATGSATNPVYVDANGDVTATSYTLGQNVPVPTASDAGKFLQADGSWAAPANTEYSTLTAQEVTTGTDTEGKLVTAQILRSELDNKQGLLGGGTSGTVLTNSGVAGTVNATVVSSSIDTTVNTDDNNIPTVGAVEGLVSSATNGNVIPERTGDCALNSGKNCALVAEADGLHWRVMAGN